LWENIEEYLDIGTQTILTHNTYPDALFIDIIETLVMFHQKGDYNFYMEFFGFALELIND
jgi:hypothetical protein